MPTFKVTEKNDESMSFRGSKDSIAITWNKGYWVDVDGASPDSINPYTVLRTTGLPIVNVSVLTIGSLLIPYVICRDKKATRVPNRRDRWSIDTSWTADAKFSQNEDDNEPIVPPEELTDITPRVVPSLDEIQRVRYVDNTDTPILTPTGNYYAEPAMERLPILRLAITQYEAAVTYEDLLDRMLKVNEGQYRNEDRYKWLIEDIDPTEVQVQLQGGITTAALITYTVSHSPHEHGWMDDRALVDTHYMAGTIKLPFSRLTKRDWGFVDSSGAALSDQTTPEYQQFEIQGEIDFDDFLRV